MFPANPKPTPWLELMLLERAQYAWLARDRVQRLEFRGGAHVWLYITAAREFHLAIWRTRVFPSDTEYWVFFRALPETIQPRLPLPVYHKLEHQGRKILKAHWRILSAAPFGADDAITTEEPSERIVDAD